MTIERNGNLIELTTDEINMIKSLLKEEQKEEEKQMRIKANMEYIFVQQCDLFNLDFNEDTVDSLRMPIYKDLFRLAAEKFYQREDEIEEDFNQNYREAYEEALWELQDECFREAAEELKINIDEIDEGVFMTKNELLEEITTMSLGEVVDYLEEEDIVIEEIANDSIIFNEDQTFEMRNYIVIGKPFEEGTTLELTIKGSYDKEKLFELYEQLDEDAKEEGIDKDNIDTSIFDNEDLYLLFFEDFSNRHDEIMDLLDEYMDEYEFLWVVSQQN